MIMSDLNPNTTLTLNDGNLIPQIGFGVFEITDKNICEKSVKVALDEGYRHIDTAIVYNNEEFVGNAIKNSSIDRSEIFITTKYFPDDIDKAREELQISLDKLKTDYIDLFLIHWPVGDYLKTWETLQDLQKEGLCKSIGVSNFTIKRFEKDFFTKFNRSPAVNQIELHLFNQERELGEYCSNKGIILEAYSPLARAQKFSNHILKSIAKSVEKSPAQVMIRYLLQKGIVVIPKSKNPKRIKENIQVFDFNLDDEIIKRLDALNEGYISLGWTPPDYY